MGHIHDGQLGADEVDDDKVGFNLNTQKLHCLVVLHDDIGSAFSDKAGTAFFRAFIVEDRKTGEVFCNQRFRYKDHDSWQRIELSPDNNRLPTPERVQYLAGMIEHVMRIGAEALAGVPSPRETILCFYPPDPEDGVKTLDWLIEQDLVEVRKMSFKGRVIPVQKGGNT